MHFGSIQLIPLVIYPGKSKMRLAGNWPWRITCQLQDAPVGLCCSGKLVFCLLYLAEAKCSRCCVDGLPKRLTNRYDFGICLAGSGTVSLKLVGIPQRIRSGSTDR